MKLTAQDVKMALRSELHKQGHTLEDFENTLKEPTQEKLAGFDIGNLLKGIAGVANTAGAASLGIGALGGTGLYAAYKANQNTNDKMMKKMKEQQAYEEATRSLHSAMLENQAGTTM